MSSPLILYMMKRIIILLISIIAAFSVFPQTFQINWQSCFGGTESDKTRDIIAIDNGYMVAGSTKSNDGDISSNHGSVDAWLVKIDNSGNLLWEKCFGGTKSEFFARIFQDTEGYLYLIGNSTSSDGDISNDPYPESTDFWIVKIDSLGNIIWDRIVGGNILDQIWTGVLTSDGGVLAYGWTGSPDGDVTVSYGAYDMWMVKLNSDGEKEWDFSIGTDWFDYGQAVIQTSDGGFLCGGSSVIGDDGNLVCEPFNYSHGEAILVKLDADRNIQWQQCYGGSDHDGVTALLEIEDGYIFGGYGGSADGDLTGSGWHYENDIWLVRLDWWGNIIWSKCFGGSRNEWLSEIHQTSDGDFLIPGFTSSHDGDVTGNHTLSEYDNDIWILKVSSDGELISQQCIGGRGDETVNFGAIKKSDNNFVIASKTTWGPSYDVTCTPHPNPGSPRADFWILEISDTTVNINENEVNDGGIKVYPNPARDYVVFELPAGAPPSIPPGGLPAGKAGEKNPIIKIHNVFGQEVTEIIVRSQVNVWDSRGVRAGIYFYKLKLENKILSGKVIIR